LSWRGNGEWLRWVIAALAFSEAGWMVFDGLRAVLTGEYTVPRSGPHAGQLGPWASVVSAVGIEPHSVGMKWFFVIYGAAWLALTVCFLANLSWAKWMMLLAAVGMLWFAPLGTLLSVLQIVLMLYRFWK